MERGRGAKVSASDMSGAKNLPTSQFIASKCRMCYLGADGGQVSEAQTPNLAGRR
jgi:hypothetical protein